MTEFQILAIFAPIPAGLTLALAVAVVSGIDTRRRAIWRVVRKDLDKST